MRADDWNRKSACNHNDIKAYSQRYAYVETRPYLELLSYLTYEALKRNLADQQLSGSLVTTDLSECDSSRPESEGTTRRRFIAWGREAGDSLAKSTARDCFYRYLLILRDSEESL
jgi:hypothetical protein